MPNHVIQAQDVQAACDRAGTPACKEIANNADLTALLVDILNGSVAAADGKVGALLGAIDKHAAVADYTGKQSGDDSLRAAATATQLLTQTLALLKLAGNVSPGVAVATIGAMFSKKVSLLFGLAENDKQAKIVAAVADLSASGLGVWAAALSLGTGPVGWVMLAAAAASVGASSYKAYATAQELKAMP